MPPAICSGWLLAHGSTEAALWVAGASLAAVPLLILCRRAAQKAVWRDAIRIADLTGAAGVRELAGWIDEEVGTPVASLLNNVGAAHRLLGRGEEALPIVSAAVDEARGAGEQVAQMIRRMRQLVGPGSERRGAIQLNDTAREVIRLTRWHANLHGVTVRASLAPELPRVRGDEEQLLQVMLSLVMAGVVAAATSVDRVVVVRTARAEDGVELLVLDSGRPISERDRSQLFTPLSRLRSGGIGIGLAAARAIIEAHGGHVTAERPSSGALLRVALPPEPPAAPGPALERAS